MKILQHTYEKGKIAEVLADDVIINTTDDGLDLLGNLYFQGYDGIIIYTKNISPDFFDLSNGMAGEVLQKFSNYRIRLAIIGDYSNIESESLRSFISESNASKHVNFVESASEAISVLSEF